MTLLYLLPIETELNNRRQKYYMIVMLVEVTTIDALVVSLKTEHLRTAHEIQQKSEFY